MYSADIQVLKLSSCYCIDNFFVEVQCVQVNINVTHTGVTLKISGERKQVKKLIDLTFLLLHTMEQVKLGKGQ